jgi:penicillin-binding protein-related factor A (putative recombinase)
MPTLSRKDLPAHVAAKLVKPADVARGARAKQQGAEFENELNRTHDELCHRIQLQQAAVSSKRLRDGRVIVTGKSGVDYVGVANGLPVAFDAKNRIGVTTFALELKREDAKRQGTERAECEFLLAHTIAKGVSFFLVRDPELARIYAIGGAANLSALLQGEGIRLRDNLIGRQTGRQRPRALVPALDLTEAEESAWRRLGIVRWDWTVLLAQLQQQP